MMHLLKMPWLHSALSAKYRARSLTTTISYSSARQQFCVHTHTHIQYSLCISLLRFVVFRYAKIKFTWYFDIWPKCNDRMKCGAHKRHTQIDLHCSHTSWKHVNGMLYILSNCNGKHVHTLSIAVKVYFFDQKKKWNLFFF